MWVGKTVSTCWPSEYRDPFISAFISVEGGEGGREGGGKGGEGRERERERERSLYVTFKCQWSTGQPIDQYSHYVNGMSVQWFTGRYLVSNARFGANQKGAILTSL